MFILKPIVHKTIWGGNRLTEYSGTSEQKIGHLYSVYDRDDGSNEILNKPYEGKRLRDIFPILNENFKFDSNLNFPLKIALVDASQNLSVQVHPNEEVCMRLEGRMAAKHESYVFLEKPKSGKIFSGCSAESLNEVEEAIKNDNIESIIGTREINEYDYVSVPATTLHALTSGSLVYEIEQGHDYTYRFYDYKRLDSDGNKRELHLDKAIQSLNVDEDSTILSVKSDRFIEEERYSIAVLHDLANYMNKSDTIECFTVVEGEAEVEGIRVVKGMSILLEPKETIDGLQVRLAVIAKYRNEED